MRQFQISMRNIAFLLLFTVHATGWAQSYLPLSGGTLSGPLVGPSLNAVVNPAACGDGTSAPSWCSGTTPDAWIAAACSQLPSNGGTLDMRGFGTGSRTVVAPLSCGSASKPVHLLFDESTIWTASSSVDLIDVQPLNVIEGFSGDVSGVAGYSANCIGIKNATFDGNVAQRTVIHNSSCNGGGQTTGNGVLIQSDDNHYVSWIDLDAVRISGFSNGIYFHATGSSAGKWITDIHARDVVVYGSAYGYNWVADKGNIEGNNCVQCSYQDAANTVYGLQLLNNGGGIFESNEFDQVNIWDTPNAVNIGSNVIRTWFRGRFDGNCLGNCGGTATDTSYNTVIDQRFCDSSACYFLGSYGGIWVNVHSGYGLRLNAVDQGTSYSFSPDSTPGIFDFSQNGVGIGFQMQGAGTGTLKAGTGSGTFVGAAIATASGANVAIPNTSSSGLGLTISGSPTAGHAACIKSINPVIIGYCSTALSSSGSCTCN